MKEQRIVIDIDHEGKISADAAGFSGDTCLTELDRLLEGLSPGRASVDRKPDEKNARIIQTKTQSLGRKP